MNLLVACRLSRSFRSLLSYPANHNSCRRNPMGLKGSSEASNFSQATLAVHAGELAADQPFGAVVSPVFHSVPFAFSSFDEMRRRSEERRVGKECRSRWSAYH